MMVAGCDVGSRTAKAVILKDGEMIGSAVLRGGPVPAESAERVMADAAEAARVARAELSRCIGTGYGRKRIPFADGTESEIACHARGALWQDPQVRTLVDIGGQDAKAVRFDAQGAVLRFTYNDRCASGTGRFLEVIAEALEIELADMAALADRATERITLSNQCVVFAETEILSLVNAGQDRAAIVHGLHHAVARRVAAMARGIGLDAEITMSGGVARNRGVFAALGEALGRPLRALPHPQLAGAIGAALFAAEGAG